ncbi:MAG: metal-dependent hydrolase [Planctomycetota bacterium]|jgi:membrane-bound metal-dependent hydrolase YbcI (DUF457 family)
MPFTPYHFGPSGFIGLALRKWLDIPVFVLANVIVDLEVLLGHGYPIHRYFHTLLIGAAAGILWATVAYPLRNLFKMIMQTLRIPYQTSFLKMLISGVLGVWLHVVIDSIYHRDVRVFWPDKARPLYMLITRQQLEALCLAFFIAAIVLWGLTAILYSKRKIKESANIEKD